MNKPDHISCRPGTTDAMQRLADENERLKSDLKGSQANIAKIKRQRDQAREDCQKAQARAADKGDEAHALKMQLWAKNGECERIEAELQRARLALSCAKEEVDGGL